MSDNRGGTTGGNYCRVEIIAQLFGVTVRRVQQLTQEGILPTTETAEGRRYELVGTVQGYVRYLSDKAYGRAQNDRESELKQQKLEADIALKESQGELHRIKTDIAAGKYIAVDEVMMDYQRFFVVFKRFALALPGRLVSRIAGSVDPLEARRLEKELQADVTQLLRAFVVAGVPEGEGAGKT